MINRMLGYAMRSFPIVRYACVGGIAFVVDWGILYVTTELIQLHYLIGATLGFICGLVVNYILSIFLVFGRRSVKSRYVEVLIFTLVGMIGLLMNDLLLLLLTEKFGIEYLKAKLVTAGVVFFWNYFARKYSLFNKKKSTIGGTTCQVREFVLSVLALRG